MTALTIPYNYTPRNYQFPVLSAMDSGIKRAVCVWHRRAGKDKTILNFVIKEMFKRIGVYYYFFPTYAQGKKILWDGIDGKGFKFLDHFPREVIVTKNATEMKITLINGSLFQIVGTDNYDSIMGTNPVGCVFSEFPLQDPLAWEYVRPIIRENGGWAIFPYTPRGFNHGWDLYQMAMNDPDWFCERLTINDTDVLTAADIEAERRSGMTEPLIQQEFYCSFEHAAGMAFRELSKNIHGIDPKNPPEYLHTFFDFKLMQPKKGVNVFRSYDWGFAKPASVGYWFSDYENRLYRWNEIYFANGPNIGMEKPTRDQGKEIKKFEQSKELKIILPIADSSIYDKPKNTKGNAELLPSDAEILAEEGVYFDETLSKQIKTPHSRIGGVRQMHDRLRIDADGKPGVYFFLNCKDFWRTVPTLPSDQLNPEDVDTDSEDHVWDDVKMMLLARPMKSHKPKPELQPTSGEYIWRKYGSKREEYGYNQ
jgi:hypothetical protein